MKGYKDVLMKKMDATAMSEDMPMDEYPAAQVCISSKDLPEIKGWKVGETYTLKFKMTSRELRESLKGKDDMHGDFALVGVDDSGSENDEPKKDQ